MFSVPKATLITITSYTFLTIDLTPPTNVEVLSAFLYFLFSSRFRGRSRIAATPKMEHIVIIVNGCF